MPRQTEPLELPQNASHSRPHPKRTTLLRIKVFEGVSGAGAGPKDTRKTAHCYLSPGAFEVFGKSTAVDSTPPRKEDIWTSADVVLFEAMGPSKPLGYRLRMGMRRVNAFTSPEIFFGGVDLGAAPK